MIAAVMGIWALALVAIAVQWPHRLVQAAIVCSVFEGAAIVKLGGLAVSPYYFTLLLVAGRCLLVRVTGQTALGPPGRVRRALACAAVLLATGVGGSVLLPRVFAGTLVMSPRLDANYEAPLSFSTSNIGQSVYLLLNVALLWYAAQTCRTAAAVRGLGRAYLAAGVIVIGFAAYQFAAAFTGVPFPSDLLYSNDSYVMQSGTAVSNMPRICSTYPEPAGLAYFLIAFALFLTGLMERRLAGRLDAALLALTITFAVLSTSSTAYLALAGVGAVAVVRYVMLPAVKGRGSVAAALAVVAAVVAAGVAVALSPTLQDLLRDMVFEKDQSASYAERSRANAFSLDLAKNTLGLGVGLGSNRASAFVPSMLSTIGVIGVTALAALVWQLVRRPNADGWVPGLHLPFAMALLGALGVLMISGPDLSSPGIWVLMAALVGVIGVAGPSGRAVDGEAAGGVPLMRRWAGE